MDSTGTIDIRYRPTRHIRFLVPAPDHSFDFPSGATGWKRYELNPFGRGYGLRKLKRVPGVYIWCEEVAFERQRFLYVGQTNNLCKRMSEHFFAVLPPDLQDLEFMPHFIFHREVVCEKPIIWILPLQTLGARLICEEEAIAFGHPVFNKNRRGTRGRE